MASFLEIKQVLKEILRIEADIDEICDIEFTVPNAYVGDNKIVFYNNSLKEAFDKMQSYTKDKLEISSTNYREVILQMFAPMPNREIDGLEIINDSVNGLTYSIGAASLEYCMFLLDAIAENTKNNGRKAYIDLRSRSRIVLKHNISTDKFENPLELIPVFLKANTLKINSDKPITISRLRAYAASFEFQFMYKQNTALTEYTDIQDLYAIGNLIRKNSRETIDSPPHRLYNIEVLDYYTMAIESRDPFTIYISFYHVIEHYFDAVFRKKLTAEITQKITHPDFSYKSETKLYELAKFIKKHMSSDDESGKGNEFDSLKYVLMEYVPINDLKNRINYLDPNAVTYYQDNFISFMTSKKIKIAWEDTPGIYKNLATRIYETRKALVHSKSEQGANQYKPYKNKKQLIAEIPLIRAISELIIINSGEIL